MYRVTARAHGLRPQDVPLDAAWDLDVRGMTRAIEIITAALQDLGLSGRAEVRVARVPDLLFGPSEKGWS